MNKIIDIYKENEEYAKINEILRKKAKELSYRTNVIKNIPNRQIAPMEYVRKKDSLYELTFKETLYSAGFSEGSSKYMFSKDLLEKVAESMKSITVSIQEELREYINQFTFEYHNKKTINALVNCYGYRDIEIKDKSEYIDVFYNKNNFLVQRKPREDDCEFCRDGGCWNCEQHRFINGVTFF